MAFHKSAESDDLKLFTKKCVEVAGKSVTLARLESGYFAVDSVCPHRGGHLCDGTLKKETGEIVCPLHGWNFDLETGVSPYNPNDCVKSYPVEERADGIYIDVSPGDEIPTRNDYLEPWRRRVDKLETEMEMIHHLADGWVGKHGYTEAMRSEKVEPLWDRVLFLPKQLAEFPLLDNDPVDLTTVIGKKAKQPITISLPVYVSHMSFGALSREAKVSLARGSRMAGTMICSGEGGMPPEERAESGTYILEMASGYFGWTEEAIGKADGIEIKIGQAAKAGMGGMLPGAKVTDEIASVRGIGKGKDALSPSRLPDINSVADLRRRVGEIKKMTGGKPVGIKIAAGRIEDDLKAALECDPDFITIDGRGGATGAAPKHVKDNICIPTLYALSRGRNFLDSQGADVDLMVTGGLRTPADFAKAIAMGATAVAIASSALMAIGCQQYRACSSGNCPVGIATQDPELRKRLDVGISAGKLNNFFTATGYQLADFARICGKGRVGDLSVDDLATTDNDITKYTTIQHVGEPLS